MVKIDGTKNKGGMMGYGLAVVSYKLIQPYCGQDYSDSEIRNGT